MPIRLTRLATPAAPVAVKAPLIVWVVPSVNWMVLPPAAITQLKLLKVVLPEIVAVVLVAKLTVPIPAVNVPELLQLRFTVMMLLLPFRVVPAAVMAMSLPTVMADWSVTVPAAPKLRS